MMVFTGSTFECCPNAWRIIAVSLYGIWATVRGRLFGGAAIDTEEKELNMFRCVIRFETELYQTYN